MEKQALITTDNLSIGYGHKTIASAINVTVNAGDLVAVIGINGAGKSTLLRTIAGLQNSLSGNIILNKQHLSSYTAQSLALQRSVVLTKQAISQNLTVAELITLGRQPFTNWLGTLTKTDHTAIADALQTTSLSDLKDSPLHSLSDGQLQRALIGRAIAQESPLLLLDEPLSHLDIHHKAAILKLLKKTSLQTGKGVLFTTHDITMALYMCTHIILIQDAKVTQGTPESFINNGILNTLFPEEHISFDKNTQQFKIVD